MFSFLFCRTEIENKAKKVGKMTLTVKGAHVGGIDKKERKHAFLTMSPVTGVIMEPSSSCM